MGRLCVYRITQMFRTQNRHDDKSNRLCISSEKDKMASYQNQSTWLDDEIDYIDNEIEFLNKIPGIIFTIQETFAASLEFILCLLSSCASVLLIYVILKTKRLKSRANLYVLNFAIVSFLDLGVFPVLTYIPLNMTVDLYCPIFQSRSFFFAAALHLGFQLAVFWYVANFREDMLVKYRNFNLYSILFAYAMALVKAIWFVIDCFTPYYNANYYTISVYCVMLVIVAAIEWASRRSQLNEKQMKMKYQFTVAKLIILSFMPSILITRVVVLLILHYFAFTRVLDVVVGFIFILEVAVVYSLPIWVVWVLRKSDGKFRGAIDSVLCKCRKIDGESHVESGDSDEEGIIKEDNLMDAVPI